jgi:hypothetical protein
LNAIDIIKGEPFYFEGSLVDDSGKSIENQYVEIYFNSEPIIDPETGVWEGEDNLIVFIPTDSSGKFKYEYDLMESFPVGTAYGLAFYNTSKPQNNPNMFENSSTGNIEFGVSANTAIVIDHDYENIDLYRGEDFVMTGHVFESYKGELTSMKVRPQYGDILTIELSVQASGVKNAIEYHLENANLGKLGTFQLKAKIPTSIEHAEFVEIQLFFQGGKKYKASLNTTIHKLWSSVFFDRAEILTSFPEVDEKSRPAMHESSFNHNSKNYRGPLIIRVPVYEDIMGQVPLPVPNAKIYLNFSEDYFVNTSIAYTDDEGVATFKFVSPLKDKDYPGQINLLYREKERYLLEVTITFPGTERLQSESTSFYVSYYPTPPKDINGADNGDGPNGIDGNQSKDDSNKEGFNSDNLVIGLSLTIIFIVVIVILLVMKQKRSSTTEMPGIPQDNLVIQHPEYQQPQQPLQQPSGTMQNVCATCGQPMSYIEQYQNYYCYNCRRY